MAAIGQSTGSAPAAQLPADPGKGKIKAVAQDFETIFLTNMFENMFDGLEDDGPFGSGAGKGPWRSMLTEQYAKSIAQSGGIGVAGQIERQLVALQESHQ